MNNKKIYIASAVISITCMALSAVPAFAAATTGKLGLKASTTIDVQLDAAARTKADNAISGRITSLNSLETRIGQMTKVSSSQKASLDATIQASIADMTTLKAKIDSDIDNTTLKSDIQSITKGYRIYALVMPQGRIVAASDKVLTIFGLFNDLSVKLQTRISSAQTAGKDITSLNASLMDMKAKTADANIQAQAAITEVTALKPDNGDTSVYASNQATLKDARAKIKAATADLKTARADAGAIVKALIAMNITVSSTTSATTTAQ